MELGPELVAVLSALVGMLVAEGLQSLSRLLNRDLSGYATALVAAIVSLVVAVVNGAFALIPAEYAPYAKGILAFLVVVLAPAGFHSLLKKIRK